MKKILGIAVGMVISFGAIAHDRWVAPFLGGVVVGHVLSQPRVVYSHPQVIYAPQPQIIYIPPPAPVVPATAPSPSQAGMWYYCADVQAYFPYVATCPSPWVMVVPRPY